MFFTQRLPILAILLCASILSSCTDISYQARQQHADQLAADAHWQKHYLATQDFDLVAYLPEHIASDTLVVYIEGDGMAWVNRSRPALNPSPRNPMALQLALQHPNNNAVYLARPCQYVDNGRHCRQAWWTNQRFAPEVVAATDEAISQLKQRYHSQRIILVGYSGGGAIAALVAARRNDVVQLVTVAGNLDHRYWTDQARLSPLIGSLNPADYAQYLKNTPQWHFVGAQDKIVALTVAQSYREYFPANSPIIIETIDNYDHSCCWAEQWPALVEQWSSN